MIIKIKSFFARYYKWLKLPWNKTYKVMYVEDPVDSPKAMIVYIVGTPEEPWQVEMVCPCGCTDKIVLPTNNFTTPKWTIKINKKSRPTLAPSVWRTKGCRSHFFLRYGRVEWI